MKQDIPADQAVLKQILAGAHSLRWRNGHVSLCRAASLSNRWLTELNLSQPELVRKRARGYLQAGAEIIETNTLWRGMRFGSKRTACGTKSARSNQAGVSIARQAVRQLADKQAVPRTWRFRWALGGIWSRSARPALMRRGTLSRNRFVRWSRAEPGVGVDLLIIETMPALNEAEQAVLAAREAAPDVPVS